jgi:hypothetical protein
MVDWFQNLLVDFASIEAKPKSNIVGCTDLKTIDLDVKRSVAHWDVHRRLTPQEREKIRNALRTLIFDVICSLEGFRYYQGVHEVCLVILQATNADLETSTSICRTIFGSHFSSLISHDFSFSLTPLLDGLNYLVSSVDPEVAQILDHSGVGYHFAVPWILTWFAHSVDEFAIICRIFGYLMQRGKTHGPIISLYLCAGVILQQREKLVDWHQDSCLVFKILQSAAKSANWNTVFGIASKLEIEYSPTVVIRHCPRLETTSFTSMKRYSLFMTFGLGVGVVSLGLMSSFWYTRLGSLENFI